MSGGKPPRREASRARVAKEAAMLLYNGQAQEYKQAKEAAARSVGFRILPSNLEVALALDELADELEGSSRKDLIVRLRKEAVDVMRLLERFGPKLVGSVWRGTAKRGSDVDIQAYSLDHDLVRNTLQTSYRVLKTEWVSKVEGGNTERYFHIYILSPSANEIEVVVKSPEDEKRTPKCEVYGDEMTGLTLDELEGVLESDPLRKFVPSYGAV